MGKYIAIHSPPFPHPSTAGKNVIHLSVWMWMLTVGTTRLFSASCYKVNFLISTSRRNLQHLYALICKCIQSKTCYSFAVWFLYRRISSLSNMLFILRKFVLTWKVCMLRYCSYSSGLSFHIWSPNVAQIQEIIRWWERALPWGHPSKLVCHINVNKTCIFKAPIAMNFCD